LSDVPNFHLLPGYIVSVAPAADGNTELILDKNDMSGIQKGDKVRVHGPGGAYFYSGPAFVLHPGETRQIEWELALGNEKIWSNGKLPAGTGYVKPLIFILDTQKGAGHCVQIHNCKMTYCE